jgi:MFS family permease
VKLLAVLALLTAVVVAQETKWAPIPKSNTSLLWWSVAVAMIGYFVLRSGWGRTESHTAEQRAIGTISNSYYEPRRSALLSGFTIVGGLGGAMWWGATSWLVLVRGIQRTTAAHGLIDLQISVIVGALAGGMLGAALGLAVGEWWERRHRQKRAARLSLERASGG